MIRVTGLFVTVLIFSSNGRPHPGSFVSTTVTPSAVMNTALLPPPPFITYRLSFSLSTSTTIGAGCPAVCWNAPTVIDSAPAPTNVPRANALPIDASKS